jgi:His-Xaa-Ser system protein HxsD
VADDRAAAELTFAAGVFDIEAIKRAAYRFSDRLIVEIDPGDAGVKCTLRPVPGLRRPEPLEVLEAHFRNEVLDQDLRMRVRAETEPLRNVILSLAFASTGLQR